MPVHAADFKLGYINVERIYREAGASIAIYKKLDKEFS
ncbi:OmpH family outer membrane protein, partial [Chromobacterium piscinae]